MGTATGELTAEIWWDHLPEGYRDLHDRTDLDQRHRWQALVTAAGDRLLRTGLGTLISGAMLPRLLTRTQFDRERERLRFYWRYADEGDADQTFVRPPSGVPVRTLERRCWHYHPRGIRSRHLSFESPFTPLHPELLRGYGRFRRNRTAHALHYCHPDGPRVPAERRLIIGGAGDRLTSPRFLRLLHDHWRGSELHWFPGNHVLHLQQGGYLRRMKQLMDECTQDALT